MTFAKIASLSAAMALTATAAVAEMHGKDKYAKQNDGRIPGWSAEASAVTGGTYVIDPTHTTVQWQVSHMGLSLYDGRFNTAEGTLSIDPDDIANGSLSVTIDAASIDTTSDKLDEELVNAAFKAEEFPEITFTSTGIEATGDNTADVTGDLTVRGTTKPTTLKVRFLGVGEHPFAKVETVGFQAKGHIKRSEFGITNWAPAIGDVVTLDIAAELRKQAD